MTRNSTTVRTKTMIVDTAPPLFMFKTRLRFPAWQVTVKEEPLEWVGDLFRSGQLAWEPLHEHEFSFESAKKVASKIGDLALVIRNKEVPPDVADTAETKILSAMFSDRKFAKKDDWLVKVQGTLFVVPDGSFPWLIQSTASMVRERILSR